MQLGSFGENLKNGLERFLNDTDVTRETPVLHILLLPLVVCLVICLSPLRWDGSHSAEVNENINLGYSHDQGYS